MAPALRTRPVAPTDLDAWLPLWDGYNAFYGRSGPTALPRSITDTTWARFFDPYEPVHALVAEQGSRLVGLAHFLLHRSTTAVAPSCYLQDLFTDGAARGTGVGRALIEAVTDRARTAGAGRLYWHTREDNRTARQLYDRVAELTGFVVYSRPLG
jgi:GNAT superfamily N-acetyltransferase